MIFPATNENIAHAASLLQRGELVAFPTETVYGLGADAGNESATRKIFAVKQRPFNDPLIVHLAGIHLIEKAARISTTAQARQIEALKHFWPGPLTVVLPKQPHIPDVVSAGLPSVAIRIPAHPVALRLLEESGLPVAAPSANKFSCVSPTCAAHVEESFADSIPAILDGGNCQVGLESTIVSLLEPVSVLLRPGAVTLEDLRSVLGEVRLRNGLTEGDSPASAPGMMKKHYSPRTPLIIRSTGDDSMPVGKLGLISFRPPVDKESAAKFTALRVLSESGSLEEVASHLFAALRELDGLGLEAIVVDSCPDEGIGLAIMDRLTKAAAPH